MNKGKIYLQKAVELIITREEYDPLLKLTYFDLLDEVYKHLNVLEIIIKYNVDMFIISNVNNLEEYNDMMPTKRYLNFKAFKKIKEILK